MNLSDFTTLTPIQAGWSGDKKYRAVTSDGTPYFLRITSRERGDRFVKLFEMQKAVAATGIPMCLPLEIGDCDEGIYTLHTWIDGEDAEPAVMRMPADEQYRLGRDAGEYLTRIHSIPAPADQPDWEPSWEERFNAKIDRKLRMYAECPIHFEGDHHLIRYIAENRHLLRGRPQCFQHGDYHIGNMMLTRKEGIPGNAGGIPAIVIIDFDRYDFGDPWEEFNRIVWCAQAAPAFASGLVDGYFGGCVPAEFWRLLALYISSNMLSSIPWAIPFGEGEIRTMLNQAADVLEWYARMETPIPTWYDPTLHHREHPII
jgi:aminoglycoside phosphotransferase (APT) family kinase protein